MDRVNLPYRSSAIKGGAAGGLFAGAFAGIFACLYSAFSGGGFLMPLSTTAASVLGPQALVDGARGAALGAALYLSVSMLWGWVFASFVSRNTTPAAALFGGLLFGAAVWAIESFIALPIVNTIKESRVALEPAGWFFENVLFGALLYLTPYFKRRYGEPTIRRFRGAARRPARV